MPTFICSAGEDFIVQQQDRGYGGRLTEVLRCNGRTGVVTVAGQEISSSGVVGATGAVTATTVTASGAVAAQAALTVGTTLAVTGASTLTGALAANGGIAVTGTATVGGKTITTGSDHSKVGTGRNLAGEIDLAGTVAGDQLVAALNLTDNASVLSSFEQTVTVTGHLQQTAAADLSTKTIFFIFHTP
jgi:hypothetical protein